MTSKKRVELGPGEGEEPPKRPRGDDVEETKAESEEAGTAVEAAGEPSATVQAAQRRNGERRDGHRDWLSFSGRREPRVGEDFQVAFLPSPGDTSKEEDPEQDKDEPKEA